MTQLRVLSYNIHKGFNAGNRRFILNRIKNSIQAVHADVVCLQEVVGHHLKDSTKIQNWPTSAQFEFLADQVWTHYSYGKNAALQQGHHGNAVLSQFPIVSWINEDVSSSRRDRRGLLHTVLSVPHEKKSIHIICIHLALLEKGRRSQLSKLKKRIQTMVPADAPLVIAGDFNDWRENVDKVLTSELGLNEVFLSSQGYHATTFPAWFPLLKLDRIYYRNLKLVSADVLQNKIWRGLSDHLPIIAEFEM